MARRLVPLLDRVLIEKIVAPTKTAGGVLLPESAAPKVSCDGSWPLLLTAASVERQQAAARMGAAPPATTSL
jgi:hypothetical protein